MNTVLGSLLIMIFLTLSVLHFYWVLGGTKGLNKAIPTDEKGKLLFNPGKIETSIVGLGLLFFALYYGTKIGVTTIELPALATNYGGWIISSVFILRAIGDFKYVGFFKKIKKTAFGKFDTKYFSLISLTIGILGLLLEIKS